MVVVEWRWICLRDQHAARTDEHQTYIPLDAGIVDNLIKMLCGHARPDLSGGKIEDFSPQSTDFAHAILLLLVQNGDIVLSRPLVLGIAI